MSVTGNSSRPNSAVDFLKRPLHKGDAVVCVCQLERTSCLRRGTVTAFTPEYVRVLREGAHDPANMVIVLVKPEKLVKV